MADPTFRSASTGFSVTTTLNVNAPAGVTANDILIATVFTNGTVDGITSVPAGWQLLTDSHMQFPAGPPFGGVVIGPASACWLYFKVATNAEPPTYTWTFNDPRPDYSVLIVDFYNVDPITPFDHLTFNQATGGASNNSPTALAITPNYQNAETLLLFVGIGTVPGGSPNPKGYLPPPGYQIISPQVGNQGSQQADYYGALQSCEPVGNIVLYTDPTFAHNWFAFNLLLKPLAGVAIPCTGPPPPPPPNPGFPLIPDTRGFGYDFGLKQWFIVDLPFPIRAASFMPQTIVAIAKAYQSLIAGFNDGTVRRIFAIPADPDWDGVPINSSMQMPDWGFPGTPVYVRRCNARITFDGGGATPKITSVTFTGVLRSGRSTTQKLNTPLSLLSTLDVGVTVLSGNITLNTQGQVLIEGSDAQTSEKPTGRVGQ